MTPYRLVVRAVRVGEQSFDLESIEDLDAEVDRICREIGDAGAEIQDRALELAPYFGVLWPAARALADWLWEHRTGLAGRTVLEVGCGLALPSFVAARAGANVLATDFHPDVPPLIERNRAANRVDFEYRTVDWRDAGVRLGEFDWVVGSDVLYDKEHPEALSAQLARHTAPGGRIVLADPGRGYLSRGVQRIESHGFASREERRQLAPSPTDEAIAPSSYHDVRIHVFTRRGSGGA